MPSTRRSPDITGEGPETLIPVFKDIADSSPKNATVWACLAWLYLLDDKPTLAFKAAKGR
ncbi:hypothetical protein NON20_08845 [Synechocystis sp. B12]|nr:hypothetical protein NON20_08845 [Synechocystis sp. B12]